MGSQIVGILGKGEADLPVTEVFRKHGISVPPLLSVEEQVFRRSVSELKCIKGLETEKSCLRQMYAELALENSAIKDLLPRKL